MAQGVGFQKLDTAPHTVPVDNRDTIKVLKYPYYEYYPTVAVKIRPKRFTQHLLVRGVQNPKQQVPEN